MIKESIPCMIIPVLKFYDKLQNMFDTIDFPINHAIILDNGGSLKDIKSDFIKEISIINMPYNLGVPTCWNLGIKLEPFCSYWLFSQDDIEWVPGGLEMIHNNSGPDFVCIDMQGPRPFSSFTVGENVISEVGIFDESYFPLIGDDFNFHKRCHYHNIKENDISGSFIAERSASIQDLANNGLISGAVINDNYKRSVYGLPVNTGWELERRRWQGSNTESDGVRGQILELLSRDYRVHNDAENSAFSKNL